IDFNNANAQTIADHLESSDPLHVASKGAETAGKAYTDFAAALVKFRNDPPHGGLIKDFKELSAVPGVTPAVLAALSNDFYLSSSADAGGLLHERYYCRLRSYPGERAPEQEGKHPHPGESKHQSDVEPNDPHLGPHLSCRVVLVPVWRRGDPRVCLSAGGGSD